MKIENEIFKIMQKEPDLHISFFSHTSIFNNEFISFNTLTVINKKRHISFGIRCDYNNPNDKLDVQTWLLFFATFLLSKEEAPPKLSLLDLKSKTLKTVEL